MLQFILSIILILVILNHRVFATELKDITRNAKQTVETTAHYTDEQRQQIQKRIETQYNELKTDISILTENISKTHGETKNKLQAELADLKLKQNQVSNSLKRFSQSSGKAWDEIKVGLDQSLDQLGQSYKKAKDQFKE